MSNDTQLTITGNLVDDPELRQYVDPDLLHPAMTSSGQRRSPAPALAAIPTVPPERAAARPGSTVRRLPSRHPDQPVRSG
jgi:hypothetical protein